VLSLLEAAAATIRYFPVFSACCPQGFQDGRESGATDEGASTMREPQSAGRWLAGVDRQLSVEGSLVGGPRFASGDISGQVWIFVQNAR
jgi:hypothetical protein